MMDTQNAIEELKAYEAKLEEYINLLEGYADALSTLDLHYCPSIQKTSEGETQIVVKILNPTPKDGAQGVSQMDPVTASLFYEAYREALPAIFTAAIQKAEVSAAARADELKQILQERIKELSDQEKQLAKLAKNGKKPKSSKSRS